MTSASPWQPRKITLHLPPDPEFVKERIAVLGCEPWLPPQSMVERAVTGIWLFYGFISDDHVLQLSARVLGINLESDDKFTRPAYDTAAWAWKRIEELAEGNRVTQPASITPECRSELIHDWFNTVMRITEHMVGNRSVDPDELAPLVCDQLAEYMQSQWGFAAFSDPYALGYHLYTERGLPGSVFGSHHTNNKAVQVAHILADGVETALESIGSGAVAELEESLHKLAFYFPALKGYLTAAMEATIADSGTSLAGQLAATDDSMAIWDFVRATALDGSAALRDNLEQLEALGWTFSRTAESERIAGSGTSWLIAALNGQVGDALRAKGQRL